MNIIVVDKCTNYCPYCFASTEMGKSQAKVAMSRESVEIIAQFLERSKKEVIPNVIGGEPFLYKDLPFVLERLLRIPKIERVCIFTGGIFNSNLLHNLPYSSISLLFNLNERRDYKKEAEFSLFHNNIETAIRHGIRIGIGFNIYRVDFDYEQILDTCEYYGLTSLRWSIACPEMDPMPGVITLPPSSYEQLRYRCFEFLEEAYQRNIDAYLDCPLPMCFFDEKQRGRLALIQPKVVSRLHACNPVIDVSPDLSVFRCFALSSVRRRKLTDFQCLEEVYDYYLKNIDMLLGIPQTFDRCASCEFARRKECFGGCIAFSKMSFERETSQEHIATQLYSYLQTSQWSEAIVLYESIQKARQTPLMHYLVALAHQALGHYDKAFQLLSMTIHQAEETQLRKKAKLALEDVSVKTFPATISIDT